MPFSDFAGQDFLTVVGGSTRHELAAGFLLASPGFSKGLLKVGMPGTASQHSHKPRGEENGYLKSNNPEGGEQTQTNTNKHANQNKTSKQQTAN